MLECGPTWILQVSAKLSSHLDAGPPGANPGGIPAHHPAMLWLIEHAGELLTTRTVGHDGRAPYERLFGKQCRED
eukprot:5125895-Alexandrium_andersonii.AAC.1